MNHLLQLGDLLSALFAVGFLFQIVGRRSDIAVLAAMCRSRRKQSSSKVQSLEEPETPTLSLLDLPELALDSVLCKLPPQSLCCVASVCKELYKRCSSDHLWVPHVVFKWMPVAGAMAFDEWQNCRLNPCKSDDSSLSKSLTWPLSCIWSHWGRSSSSPDPKADDHHHLLLQQPRNTYMRWYSTLESGTLWFPAQVYNREHGHVGFLLSCYDAELCYDRHSDTFTARYPPHGSCSLLVEDGVSWERLRAPPVAATAHELYISDSLDSLKPGDHVEVQWRRNKRFPYGWWYGVVGHQDTCDKDPRSCRCHVNDLVWLEFNQYAPGSRWRRTGISRISHREKGNDAEGFYAGVRKLQTKEEISTWMKLWPREPLE